MMKNELGKMKMCRKGKLPYMTEKRLAIMSNNDESMKNLN